MIALEYVRSVPRYAASRALARKAPGLVTGALMPLRAAHRPDPALPSAEWVRVRPILAGICGSDLALLTGSGSMYFEPMMSMPFVPGHEILAETGDGRRVVVEPVLHCGVRGIPPCAACSAGRTQRCERTWTAHGLSPGLQTGYCADTSGGWSTQAVVHPSQIHEVPAELSDEAAVLVEPLACAVHAVLRARIAPGDTVLLAGAGTIGLLCVAAVRGLTQAGKLIVVAKHPRQRSEAARLGADQVVAPDSAGRAARAAGGALTVTPARGGPWLAGGVDVSLECAGSMGSLDTCLRATRPGGKVVLVGLPSSGKLDPAPIWHRELSVLGAYAYGSEQGQSTFQIAMQLAGRFDLAPLVSAAYPLSRWREAIDHALDAGRLDAVKVVFKP